MRGSWEGHESIQSQYHPITLPETNSSPLKIVRFQGLAAMLVSGRLGIIPSSQPLVFPCPSVGTSYQRSPRLSGELVPRSSDAKIHVQQTEILPTDKEKDLKGRNRRWDIVDMVVKNILKYRH